MKKLFTSLVLSAYFFAPSFADSAELKELKIGTLPAADSLLLYAADNAGIFEKHGLDVEVIPFQSAVEVGAAMRAKELDGHFGDVIGVILQNESGAPQQVIATTSYSNKNQRHFAIVASPKVDDISIENLKGKKVAIGGDTIVDYLLTQFMTANNLENNYFQVEDIRAIPMRLQLLMLGQVELALLPEPLVTTVEAQGAKVVLDDTNLTQPLAVIALRSEVDDETIKQFRSALYDAANHINTAENKDLYINMMLEKGLISPKIKDVYKLIQFDTTRLPLYLPTKEEIQQRVNWMQNKGIIKTTPVYENFVWQEK